MHRLFKHAHEPALQQCASPDALILFLNFSSDFFTLIIISVRVNEPIQYD